MQEVEEELSNLTQAKQSPLIQQIVVQLNDAVVYSQGSNTDVNRKLWNNYAIQWGRDKPWLQKMASDVGMSDQLECIGDEWAPRHHTMQIIEDFIYPYINSQSIVAEIGVGGGRIAVQVAGRVRVYRGYDISKEMVKFSSAKLAGVKASSSADIQVHLLPLENQKLNLANHFDFIYSFDVFPHVDTHTIFHYLREIYFSLKFGGLCFFSTSNILSKGGWERFEKQSHGTVGGFCFTSPDIVRHLIIKAGLEIAKEGNYQDDNVYYRRDYLVLVRKPVE